MRWIARGAGASAPVQLQRPPATVPPAEPEAESTEGETRLGSLPLITLIAALGLLICAVVAALARASLGPPEAPYWAGLLIIVVPIFYRLCSEEPSPGERLALVCLLGMTIYGVKLAHDSLLFVLPDELVHAFNANQIAHHHELFTANSVLPVTPDYPGLEGATSALMTITGISSFGAGIIVIGAARLVLMVGLFLLFRRISGSARLAGVGAGLYAANPNFLLWGAQFSYQSLALPLFVLVLFALVERDAARRTAARRWSVPIVLGIVAVVVTHHVTSFLLVGTILVLMAARPLADRRAWKLLPPLWPFAALAAALTGFWVAVVAESTPGYLWGPLRDAFVSVWDTITLQEPLRALFGADAKARGAGVGGAPLGARFISFTSVLILLIALPIGLRQVWHRYRRRPAALLFCVGAVAFFGALALRLVSAAWETGNRASEFAFIGLAFTSATVVLLGIASFAQRRPQAAPWMGRALATGAMAFVLLGAAISGWPWDSQLPKPVRATVDGREIASEPLGAARWVATHLPPGAFASSEADGRFLLVRAGRTVRAGKNPDIDKLLKQPVLKTWHLPTLRKNDVRYLLIDRRRRSADIIRGYPFELRPKVGPRDPLLPKAAVGKFEQLPFATRVFHSGRIVIFDLEGGQ